MDLDRSHRSTSTPTTTSELFICFTSLLSKSSSTNKSSSTTSLSRGIRHNGSLRGGGGGGGSGGGGGGQSPAMFLSKKNKGCSGLENPEPSSPKVTCIGQVRVKTRKQGKKMKMMRSSSRSRRLHSHALEGGLTHQNSVRIQNQHQDYSLSHRNQRWVHLPLTICEALRAFGAEFSCFLHCKPSCFNSSCTNERERGLHGKRRESSSSSSSSSVTSCGALFRWLVAIHEEEVKERNIELMVGKDETMILEREDQCSRRRSIFDDMEFDVKNDNNGEEEAPSRVSICIPPKNALLLMRCRSDPVKMASLSRKLCEIPIPKDDDNEDEEERDVGKIFTNEFNEKTEEIDEEQEKMSEGYDGIFEDWVLVEANVEDSVSDQQEEEENQDEEEEKQSTESVSIVENQLMEVQNLPNGFSIENLVPVNANAEDWVSDQQEEENQDEEEEKQSTESRRESVSTEENHQLMVVENLPNGFSIETIVEEERLEESINVQDLVKNSEHQEKEEENQQQQEEEKDPITDQETMKKSMEEKPPFTHERFLEIPAENVPNNWEKEEEEISISNNNPVVLPDCLLLMMCEPKLSMEVSKETWVCNTDFIRWLPERHHIKKASKIDGYDESTKKKGPPPPPPQPAAQPVEAVQSAVQPARSSISFPAGVGYQPFVLTRCKSAGFVRVGAAGVGF